MSRFGPRARRRLATIGIAVAVAIAIVVALTAFGGSSHHTSRRSLPTYEVGPNGDKRYVDNSAKVIFGMTKTQMRKLVGPPTKVVGSCWEYRLDEAISEFGQTNVVNADRDCFYEGRYAVQYTKWNGTWQDASGNPATNPTH